LADNPAAEKEYERTKEKMESAFQWFKKECASLETRGSGRVTTALLDPVRVDLGEEGGGKVRLVECATVGVREGTTLLVTAFDDKVRLNLLSNAVPRLIAPQNLKRIEAAIYEAKLPGITPQKQDARTLRVAVPRWIHTIPMTSSC
jgi:ribosome recycling factor